MRQGDDQPGLLQSSPRTWGCFHWKAREGEPDVLASDSGRVEDAPVCSGRSGLPRMVRREASGSGNKRLAPIAREWGEAPKLLSGEFGKRALKENFDRGDTR